ncbi:MAG: hypothetical protein RLZZ59_18, partial [Pseudomonadota bacterium]
MIKTEFLQELDPDLKALKERDWEEYDSKHGAHFNYKTFAVVLKDDTGEVAGAVEGYTIYDEVYIDDFWVHSKHRGRGYGTGLMRAIEDEFRGKGFNNMNLCTSHFQAPEFYKKCGFTLEFIRENAKNPKLSKYFFVKFFDDEEHKQGLLDSN